ncbi:MAG: hypothetical protein LBN05_07355 [Oscillospiraceae bacterium]|jgi:hypothetical protein|nr:hypothetical protein [Oscillospiraceae bacterium]
MPILPLKTKILWYSLRAALLAWGIVMLCLGHGVQFAQALGAIGFTHLWDFFQIFGAKGFISRFSYTLQSRFNVFIALSCVIGTSLNVFTSFVHIDIPEHFYAGFLAACFGWELAHLMQAKYGTLSPALGALCALSISLAVLTVWEIYEFSVDRLFGLTLQNSLPTSDVGLLDTMWDLIVGTGGALLGMGRMLHLRKKAGRTT